MNFFNQPKPRKFHHEFIYVDERRERLERLKENAEYELGRLESEKIGSKVEGGTRGRVVRFRRIKRSAGNERMLISVGASVFLIVLLVFLLLSLMEV